MKFKAVIFDLDGTLLDSLKGIADAMNLVLEKLGYEPHHEDDYRAFVGSGIKELVRRALPDEWFDKFNTKPGINKETSDQETDRALDEQVAEFRTFYNMTWPTASEPYSGVTDLLSELNNKGIKVSILSNKSEDFTRQMVSSILGDFSFLEVRGARDGIPRKPDPAAALDIAIQMNVFPYETAFVGDSGIDMQTAVNAGMFPVGVKWGFKEADELVSQGAQQLIRHPMELTEALSSVRH